jgi:hypothetical protein
MPAKRRVSRENDAISSACVDHYAALGSQHENSLKSRRSDSSHEEPRYICMQGHFTGADRPVETTALTPEPFP